jgi:hypothetical protein
MENTQRRKVGKLPDLKFWEQKKKKPTGRNMIAKIGYCHLCLRGEKHSVANCLDIFAVLSE